jgi:transposase, IS30 family
MEQKNCSIKGKKYVHITEKERYKIEGFLENKMSVKKIAFILRRSQSTIYREIDRGVVSRLQGDLSEKEIYRANFAQADYEKQGKNKERSLKIGKDKDLEAYIRVKLTKERFSPDAIIGQIKVEGLVFKGIITTKTLYNYIDSGVFTGISNKNLWQKRDKKKRGYKTVSRVSTKNKDCRSIEDRPKKVDNRIEHGHWEGDTVKGPLGSKAGLFTLTERKTREEIIVKIYACTQEAIKRAIDDLEKKYGYAFRIKFKSITFDNGVEFLGWRSLEVSVQGLVERRTTIYFAHPYSSWERGTNENQNRMIRRFIPKGTNIANVSEEEIQWIQDWINNYPRKLLGYKTANQMTKVCLQSNN